MPTANRTLNSGAAGLVLVLVLGYVVGVLVGSATTGWRADSLALDLLGLGLILLGIAGFVICIVGVIRGDGLGFGVTGLLLFAGFTVIASVLRL